MTGRMLAGYVSRSDGFITALTALSFDEGKLSFERLTEDMAETFVERAVVMPGRQVSVEWKFGE